MILSPLWVVLVSAEVGAWRLQEEGYHPPEHFDPLWKLFYMWEHRYHFPLAAWRAFSGWGGRLWQDDPINLLEGTSKNCSRLRSRTAQE